MHPLPPWSRRDNFSVPAHQRLVDGINSLSFITGTGDMEVTSTPGGRMVHNNRPIMLHDLFWAEVTDEGPNGEDPPDAPEFWLQRKRVQVQDEDPDEPEVELVDDEVVEGDANIDEDGEMIADTIVKGTDPTGEASLTVGQKVFVIGTPSIDAETGEHFWRNLILPTGGTGLTTCRIAGSSSGGVNFGAGTYDGWTQDYAGSAYSSTAHASYPNLGATNNVSMNSIGLTDGEQVILRNMAEDTTIADTNRAHVMPANSYVHAVFKGFVPYSGTNLRKLYEFRALPAIYCG